MQLHPKLVGVMQSRKVWAGVLGLVTTATLWWLGEIDGARAVEAMTWVLGSFIGSVALEDGMTRLFSTLGHAVQEKRIVEPSALGNGVNPPLSSAGKKYPTLPFPGSGREP